jgi:protein TonB
MGAPGGGPMRADPGEQELKPAPKLVEARAYAGNQQPIYTDAARRKGLEGLMVIEVDIDEQGRVKRAIVRGKIDPEMDEAARRLVERWKFEPATLGGRPVARTTFLRFRFKLE